MELPHLGRNCALSSCNQLDFLPHRCSCCHLYFCEEHKDKIEHDCTGIEVPSAQNKQSELCPICEKSIVYVLNEDINVTMEKHMNSNFCVKKKKLTCPIEGCKEKIYASNQYECMKCQTVLCLAHRHEEHRCEEIRRSRYQPLGKQKTRNSGMFMLHASKKREKKGGGGVTLTSSRSSALPSATCEACHKTFPHRAALLAHRCSSKKKGSSSGNSCAVS